MSAYSFPWLRSADLRSSWTNDTSSKASADDVSPLSTSQNAQSSSSYPMNTPPQPHPYQLAAYSSPGQSASPAGTTAISYQTRSEGDRVAESTEGHTFTQLNPVARQAYTTRPRSHHTVKLIAQRPIFLFLMFLPIPPLLALLYMVTGHSILRHAHPQPTSIYSAPLSSSAEAGATGGAILSIPLAVCLRLILHPTSKTPEAPEDFFEDDDASLMAGNRWVRYASFLTVLLLVLCIGGAAGPLGVTCLSSGAVTEFRELKKMLSPGAAAAAGMVGGLLLGFGSITLAAASLVCWAIWIRRSPVARQ